MLKRELILFLIFSLKVWGQEIPYGEPIYLKMKLSDEIHQLKMDVPSSFPSDLIQFLEPIEHNNKEIYHLIISLDDEKSIHFKIIDSALTDSTSIYIVNLNTGGWVGPYTKNIMQHHRSNVTGQIKSQSILIEISVPSGTKPIFPFKELISSVYPSTMVLDKPKIDLEKSIHSKNILLCGYWPPSNEAIRPFSESLLTNPDGWIGENWENRGYDIYSYFPEFDPKDCENCGKGKGAFEIDIEKTFENFWDSVELLNPVAIITFSRGYIDYSWELEWHNSNRFLWIDDTIGNISENYLYDEKILYSSLPTGRIVKSINEAELGLNSYVDYHESSMGYLSEILGYQGVWYKTFLDSLGMDCVAAGHIHIGGLVDWDVANKATKITLREVIQYIDEMLEIEKEIKKIVEIGGIKFDIVKNGNRDRKYIWFHGDEKTAYMALDAHMKNSSGTAYFIQNDDREINYHGGLIDPNRIFSSDGTLDNINKYNIHWSNTKKKEILTNINQERNEFLEEIFPQNGGVIVAIHNNFRGYNVHKEIDNSDSISIKEDQNPRDFFLCTNTNDFKILAKSPYNVVLQEKWKPIDDGSLSWAALRHDIRYILLETRLGWLKKQTKMLKYLDDYVP